MRLEECLILERGASRPIWSEKERDLFRWCDGHRRCRRQRLTDVDGRGQCQRD